MKNITDYLTNLYTEETGKDSHRSIPMYPNRFDRTPEFKRWLTTNQTAILLEGFVESVFIANTSNLRNIISEITGIDSETVQNDNHIEAMKALKKKSEETRLTEQSRTTNQG